MVILSMRNCCQIRQYSLVDIYFSSHHLSGSCCVDILGEITYWSLVGEKGFRKEQIINLHACAINFDC